jgi:hypothetical protein
MCCNFKHSLCQNSAFIFINDNIKRKEEKIKRKIKRDNENLLFSSLRQFNALQIELICFNCFTKRLSKHIFLYICIKKYGHV